MDILNQLANRNKQQNKDAEIITHDCHQKKLEYAAEGEYLHNRGFSFERNCVLRPWESKTLRSVFKSFTVAKLPYRPCGLINYFGN